MLGLLPQLKLLKLRPHCVTSAGLRRVTLSSCSCRHPWDLGEVMEEICCTESGHKATPRHKSQTSVEEVSSASPEERGKGMALHQAEVAQVST